jgi:ABC-type transport system involved in cytochrome bd biosynthesis fused ATPase/permease subunit
LPPRRSARSAARGLFAAVAVHSIAAAALAAEGVGHYAQHAISGLVAVTVVERLEAIEVAEQHAVGVAVADAARVEADEILFEPEPGSRAR